MSDKSLFRRNLLIIVGLHILVIGLFFLGGLFPKRQENVEWIDGGGSPSGAQSAQPDETQPENTPDEMTPESPPEKTPDDSGTSAPSMITLGTPPPVATPTPTPHTPTPSPKPTQTPRTPTPTPPSPTPKRTPRPTPSPKKSPSRPPSPKASPKKSASPKSSPKHSASPSESAKPKPTDASGEEADNGASETPGTDNSAASSHSKGKPGTKPGDGGGNRGGHGKAGGGEQEINWYLGMIRDRFYSRWSQPTGIPPDITATVKIRIEKDGRISSVSLEKSSGNPIMDESAMTAAKSVTKVDPLPDAIEDSFYDVPIEFQLTPN